MASVDQGASQRRAGGSQVTPVGQASALFPKTSSGESYSNVPLGELGGRDEFSGVIRRHQDEYTKIGTYGSSEVSSSQGTAYPPPLGVDNGRDLSQTVFTFDTDHLVGTVTGHDAGSSVTRFKESLQFKIGLSTLPDGTSSYFEWFLGAMSPIGGGGTAVSHYKLRAQDDGALPAIQYVYWTSLTVDISTYPFAPPFGGPLSHLVILARY